MLAEAPSGRLILGNAQVERIWGRPFVISSEEEGYRSYPGFRPEDGRPLGPDESPLARALAGETIEAEEIGFVRPDGSRGTMLSWAAPIRDRAGTITAGVEAFTDISERRSAQENQRYLTEASQVLGSSLDYEETLRRIAALAVPRICDWMSVDLVDDAGDVAQIVVAHADPAKVELARQWRERYPPAKDSPQGTYAIMRTGVSELITDIPPEMLDAAIGDDADRRAVVEALSCARTWACRCGPATGSSARSRSSGRSPGGGSGPTTSSSPRAWPPGPRGDRECAPVPRRGPVPGSCSTRPSTSC